MMYIVALLLIVFLIQLTSAQANFTVSSCVDPSGYDNCFSTATSNAATCVQRNGGNPATCYDAESCFFNEPELEIACGCQAYTAWMNCALSFCWDQVYSCAYQVLAIGGLNACGSLVKAFPPYFPPPANAPGGCNCNIGAAYSSVYGYLELSDHCASRAASGLGFVFEFDCFCCAYSGALSALPDICPNINPSSIPGWPRDEVAEAGIANCAPNLETATCTASPLDFPTPTQAVNPEFYLPGAIPTGGSINIFDTPGRLSSPISGTILTWSIVADLPTVATAASPTKGGSSGAQSTGSASNDASSDRKDIVTVISVVSLTCVVISFLI